MGIRQKIRLVWHGSRLYLKMRELAKHKERVKSKKYWLGFTAIICSLVGIYYKDVSTALNDLMIEIIKIWTMLQ